MDSTRLSLRAVQPGHNQKWRDGESALYSLALDVFPADKVFKSPRIKLPVGKRYYKPDLMVTGEKYSAFIELKEQGKAGNAYERACKHYTPGIVEYLDELMGWDGKHFFYTLLRGGLVYHTDLIKFNIGEKYADNVWCWNTDSQVRSQLKGLKRMLDTAH